MSAKRGWFSRLRERLSRTSNVLKERILAVVVRRKVDEELLEELEEVLILADLGVETAGRLVRRLRRERFGREVDEREVRELLAAYITDILAQVERPLQIDPSHRPHVILVCGVNGTGKTTTIGKLARLFRQQGLKVMLAACDTFRAAAIEQLRVWGERTGCPVVEAKPGADAAGLAYSALERARKDGFDVLLIDTAGRLHNRKELMDELAKIARVVRKLDPSAPHDVLLVLDATTGQNAHAQVQTFREMVDVTGLVITKLDGTAKGGVVVALAERFGLPVHFVGIGEGPDDLRPFDARSFARALLGLEEETEPAEARP
ncbi:Signal recognition particle receptor FtsY [bacterium HR39]|nr:Signal recognition particle receptor FtsY [bacterium HR39]